MFYILNLILANNFFSIEMKIIFIHNTFYMTRETREQYQREF
jgi:hypothetical protein